MQRTTFFELAVYLYDFKACYASFGCIFPTLDCVCLYTELGISNNVGASYYTIADLYKNGPQILEETISQIQTDPLNKIKGSQHGPQLISIANSLLKNQVLCDGKKFQLIIAKIWKFAVSGDSRKLPANQCAKMWT